MAKASPSSVRNAEASRAEATMPWQPLASAMLARRTTPS